MAKVFADDVSLNWLGSGPYVSYTSNTVYDPPPGGNSDGRFDPGESGQLVAFIRNIGNEEAQNVTGTLRSGHSQFTITDPSGTFGNIPAGGSGNNNSDRFAATAGAAIPPGTMVPCTLKLHSDNWAHDWTCVFRLQVGVPPMPGQFVIAIDTGSVSLSVCAIGSIGYDEPAQTQGSGFQVPKGSANTLYFGGMMAGNDGSYLVDHFYSRPASGATNHDWRMADSLRFILPTSPADEHWTNSMTDAGHPTPKGLSVEQHWYMNAVNGYKDWAIAAFDFKNSGSSAINGVYAAMVGDFDIGTSTSNVAGSDTVRRSVWMEPYGSESPTVGFVLLDPGRFANLSAIDHALYVYPTSAMTDTQKYQLMNGTIVLRQSDRSYDWSIIASAGPFNLPVGAEQRVAFAVVGATSLAQWLAFGDSAQRWYNANMLGIVEQPVRPSERQPVLLSPNPFARGTCVRYFTSSAGELELAAFDATGRQVELVRFPVSRGIGTCYWQPEGLAPGIYFLRVKTPDRETTQKALLTE